MDGYTLSISRCSGGDGVEESFKAKIKRREAALDAFAVAEAYCKESWMVSRCEREGFDGFIIDLCSDAEDETIRLVRLVPDSEDGIMDDVFRLEYGSLRGLLSQVKGIREGALFLWLFGSRPAGGVKARGRCGNGDSGRLSHPSNSLRVGLRTLRPLKARKSLLLGGNGGQTCRGFQHSDRLRVSLGTLRPSEC